MGLMDPAFKAALAAGATPVPVLQIAFPNSQNKRYAGDGFGFDPVAPGPFEARVDTWTEIAVVVSERPGQLSYPETTVTVTDVGRDLTQILEGKYEARKSAAAVKLALSGVASSAWFPLLTGVVDRWRQTGLKWDLTIRPDDRALQGYVPKTTVTKGNAPLADTTNKSPYGRYMPIVYGVHDASALTGQGMLPTINVRFDGTLGWYYLVSLGRLKSVDRVYKNGTLQTVATHYNVIYPLLGGVQTTCLSWVSAPATTDVIQCDVNGIESVGDGTGQTITNPVDILKHFLVNFVWNNYRSGLWFADSTAPIDALAFATAAGWASRFSWEGAKRIGGDTTQQRGVDLVNEWLTSWPTLRLWWNNQGKLACGALSHLWTGYIDDPWFRGMVDEKGDSLQPYRDTYQILDRVAVSYIPQAVAGGYGQSLDLQDMDAPEKSTENFQLAWSAARII